jgi:hypothetical protein
MKTLFAILLLAIFGIIATFLAPIILNIAGLPGAVVAGMPGKRTKSRFVFGSIVSAIGQSYVYLAYSAFVLSWTIAAASREDVVGFVLWPIAFLTVLLPVYINLIRARVEAKELKHANAQTEALHLTFLISLLSFFVFSLAPTLMKTAWGWIPYVSR